MKAVAHRDQVQTKSGKLECGSAEREVTKKSSGRQQNDEQVPQLSRREASASSADRARGCVSWACHAGDTRYLFTT